MIGPIERLLMNSTVELAVGSGSFEDYKQNFDALIKNFGKMVNISEDWMERLKRGGAEIFVRSKLDGAEQIEDEEKREEEIIRYASDLFEAAVYTRNKGVVDLVVKKTSSTLQKRRPDIALERAVYLIEKGYFEEAIKLAGPYAKLGKDLRHL